MRIVSILFILLIPISGFASVSNNTETLAAATGVSLAGVGAAILLHHSSGGDTSPGCNPLPNSICNTFCINHIQSMLDNYRLQHHIPAMQMTLNAINVPQQTFCSGTLAKDDTTAVNKNSLFEIGSNTKAFVAAIILQLEAEGKLSLDDTVGKWFPEYADWRNVTVRQLLNMTGGIKEYLGEDFLHQVSVSPESYWSQSTLTNLAYAENPNTYFSPGTGWWYSNTQYSLAGMIIEAVTNKSLRENLEERIFKPLQLQHTFYYNNLVPSTLPSMVHGYYLNAQPDFFANKDLTNINISVYNSAGAIISTSDDLARWVRGLFSGKVLKPEQLAEMTTDNLVCVNKALWDEGQTCTSGQKLPPNTNQFGFGLALMKYPNNARNGFGNDVWFEAGGTYSHVSKYFYVKDTKFIMVLFWDTLDSSLELSYSWRDFMRNVYKYVYNH